MFKLSKPRLSKRQTLVGSITVAYVVLAGLSGYVGARLEQHGQDQIIGANYDSQKRIVTSESRLISQIAKGTGPSVVSINVLINGSGARSRAQAAAGTGIIISSKGMIMTNRHVIPDGTDRVSVVLSDGSELDDVSVIGRTSSSDSLDVAFLKINNTEGHGLKAATLGDSSRVQVGDQVVAIGNALGQFQNSVTSGIISGFGRSVQAGDSSDYSDAENLDNLIQTDAAINEGNSGGPLVNLNGQVIGLNTAIAGDAQNIGFAIPINDIKGIIRQVLDNGKVARPYIGVRYVPLTADIAKEYKLKTEQGAYIVPSDDPDQPPIIADGPAAKAGLKEGDIITSVNGKKVDQSHSLTSLLGAYKPNDNVKLSVIRDGKTIQVSIKLGTLSAD